MYTRDFAEWRVLTAAAARRGWPVPVVYAAHGCAAAVRGPALGRLEAAVATGRHDGLLLPLPTVLGDTGRLMQLLALCTRLGVLVGFEPVEQPAARPPAWRSARSAGW